jgi:hypothetical protein
MINDMHHGDLIDNSCDIFSDYLLLHILEQIVDWVDWKNKIKQWDIMCYSEQQKISRMQAMDSIPAVGFLA